MKKLMMTAALTVAAVLMTTALAVAALSLDTAKQQGLVGERTDGTLGIVAGATPEVSALVAETNRERVERYQAIAAKNGTGLSQVQALAGKRLIDGARAGEFIQGADGSWQRK